MPRRIDWRSAGLGQRSYVYSSRRKPSERARGDLILRAATFVTSSPFQLRPTYAIEGSAKRSKSVRLPNTKEHSSRDLHVIRQVVSGQITGALSLRSEILGSHYPTWQSSFCPGLACGIAKS